MDNIIELINNNNFDKAYDILNKKTKLNEFIVDKNNILHICAIRGNEKIFKLLKDNKIDKFLSNGRGENVLHLLFRNGFDKMGLKVAEAYPDLLDYVNSHKIYPVINCIDRINTLEKVLEIIISKKYFHQINSLDINDNNLISIIISKNNKDYLKIIKLVEKYIDYTLPKTKPVLIYSILNKNLTLVKYFIEKDNGIDIPNVINLYPIHAALNIGSNGSNIGSNGSIGSIEIIEDILNSKSFKPELLNYGGPSNNYLPLNMCLSMIEKTKNTKFINVLKLMLDKIKNYSLIDMDKNTYGHHALDLKYKIVNLKNTKDKILIKLLDKIIDNSDKDLRNLDGVSLNDILKNKKSKIPLEKCNNQDTQDKKTDKVNKDEKDDKIVFPETNYKSNNGLFNSDIIHNMMYFIYILRKYNSVCMPLTQESEERNKKVNSILAKLSYQNIPYDPFYSGLREIINIGYDTFPSMMPSIILWKNSELNWFDPDFNKSIETCMKSDKRFIMIKISHFPRPESLHANVIVFDKDDNSYRRFEPYGYISTDDEMYLDKLVMDIILKFRKTKIKYFKPGDFLEKGRFQTISNDSSAEVRKTGDPFGYCLAWCLWYIELKLNNPAMKETDLIEQAADKIFNTYCDSDTPYIDFIRDYARKLNDEKDKLFEEFGLSKENFYNVAYNKTDLDKITNGVNDIVNNLS